MNPAVAMAVAHDPEAPIKIILKIIPYLGLTGLRKLSRDETTHQIIRDRIQEYLQQRPTKNKSCPDLITSDK
jgi:hypothetical protein